MSHPLSVVDDHPWYHQGLRFKCTGCGQCCTGEPGAVWVSEEEVVAIADELGITVEEFSRLYLRRLHGRLSLKEDPHNYDCVFLKDNRCQVYKQRPKQCRTFPWWVHNLTSKEDWENAAHYCEGINHPEAPIVPFDEIQTQLNS
ncbi:MAG: YkgJ family cysteine cluster protein [Chlamydiales bacterium]|nr:YkgJ family cysteine cluster protein [Chlamydiia bacterium]MCP5507580.1 YkgJ family cysteine cluster protein [Chlamydiales bacterium]